MTIAVLRSLHAIIGDAIDDIERIYAPHGRPVDSESTTNGEAPGPPSLSQNSACQNSEKRSRPDRNPSTSSPNSQAYASPPPSPSITTTSDYTASTTATLAPSADTPAVDFPSLDLPCNSTSLSETLTTHPTVLDAIGRIVAAAGQLSATVQVPFLTICDAIMGVRSFPRLIRPFTDSSFCTVSSTVMHAVTRSISRPGDPTRGWSCWTTRRRYIPKKWSASNEIRWVLYRLLLNHNNSKPYEHSAHSSPASSTSYAPRGLSKCFYAQSNIIVGGFRENVLSTKGLSRTGSVR